MLRRTLLNLIPVGIAAACGMKADENVLKFKKLEFRNDHPFLDAEGRERVRQSFKKEYFEGREVIRVEIDSPIFEYRHDMMVTRFRMDKRPELFPSSNGPGLAKHLARWAYKLKDYNYIYIISHKDLTAVIPSVYKLEIKAIKNERSMA